MEYDVVIIGCGVVGAAIARELSQYDLKILVLEKNTEVCTETSKANSGIMHGGYDAKPGTLKALLNVRGNALARKFAKEMDFCFKQTGSIVVAFSDEEKEAIEHLYKQAEVVQAVGVSVWEKNQLHEKEPELSEKAIQALYCSSAGVICPFDMTYGCIENAIENGVELITESPVIDIKKANGTYTLCTPTAEYKTHFVINAAGLYSDKIANLAGDNDFTILPRKGEYRLLDKSYQKINHVIFQAPSKMGKGILVSPTSHGNVIVGPTAEDIPAADDTSVTKKGIDYLDNMALKSVPNLPLKKTIRVFTGVRARPSTGDFMIYESKHSKGIIHAGGIESPGLSSALAIGEYVANLLESAGAKLIKKTNYQAKRTRPHLFIELDKKTQNQMIAKNPAYGHIICRCENITEGEIIDVIHRFAGSRTLDSIKRRARPGSGRCQGGFCAPRVMEIISRELNIPLETVLKENQGSTILTGQK